MAKTFFFYDLETSGLNPREDRIMQFAGRRTTLDFAPLGEPYNLLVKLNDDILPSPEAVMVTGITPQMTQADGYTEAEFAKILEREIFTEDTIAVGYNNVRFDDEFIRYLFWRNFYDPYEWSYKDGRSRWDMLDVVRMTRALRPEGINWPFDNEGKATNRLELLAQVNKIEHTTAHDALSDVDALIAVTKLIKDKQPKLFNYLLELRDKKAIQKLVNLESRAPFVYVSGRYEAEFNKATVAYPLASGRNGNILVYDLRYGPTPFLNLSEKELKERLFANYKERKMEGFMAIPIKEMQYNRCPAVAMIGVLMRGDGWQKLQLSNEIVKKNLAALQAVPHFAENVRSAFEDREEFEKSKDAEGQLYDGFVDGKDKLRIEKVRRLNGDELVDFQPEFSDERLPVLLLHYKARSFPTSLSESEQQAWEQWRSARITAKLPAYLVSLQKIAEKVQSGDKSFLLEELQLWAESIMPDTS